MEIPDLIKKLYRHWNYHIIPNKNPKDPGELFDDQELFDEIALFIEERIKIWKKKVSGEEPPYTKDPTLCKYRFCNIFREFDRQTIEIHQMLNPIRKNFPLWLLNMFYCRMVARPETIQKIGLLDFEIKNNKIIYKKLMAHPKPKYGTPYVFPISTLLKSSTPTRELFLTKYLPKIIPGVAEEISTWERISANAGLGRVLEIFDFNLKFLWTEVLIDVAYQYPEKIDLFKEFPVGPGAKPTFQKISKEKNLPLVAKELSEIDLDTKLTFNGKTLRLSAENWEGIGCEFRKYMNLKQGKGRKRLFK